MHDVIHIIDGETPLDLLRQLDLLASVDEPVFSVGPAPEFLARQRTVHTLPAARKVGPLPLGSPRPLGEACIVHTWMDAPFDVRLAPEGAKIIQSLSAVPREPVAFDSRITLTVPTPPAARLLVQQGVPVTQIAVLPPSATEPTDPADRRRRMRGKLGLTDDQFVLVAPGELIPPAGQKYAPWALAILLPMLPGVRVIIPDGGPYSEHVRYFAANTGCSEKEAMFLAGKAPLHESLCAGDAAFVFPEYDCGIQALAEAMAAGLPIVAADTPDIAYASPHSQCALLAPPRQPRMAAAEILKLIDDPALARRLGDAAQARARELFTPAAADKVRRAIYAGELT